MLAFGVKGGSWGGLCFFFQAEDGIRDHCVTGVQTCALPISLDHAGDARLDRLEQLALALLRLVLELAVALLEALLQLLQVTLLRLLRRRGEGDRLLVERPHGRVEPLLQLLHLVAVPLDFLVERRLRGGVARGLLQDRLIADKRDLEPGLRLRSGRDRHGQRKAQPRPHCHCTPHDTSPQEKLVQVAPRRRDRKSTRLNSLKCSLKPGAGRPSASVRSKPYAQSMPIGPSGEMMLRPMPAPRNSRVGLNSPARAHTLPASTNVLT